MFPSNATMEFRWRASEISFFVIPKCFFFLFFLWCSMIFLVQFCQRLSFVNSGGSGQLSPGGAVKVQRVSERATEFKRLRPRTRLPLTSVIEEEEEAEKKRRIINYLLLLLLQQFLVSVAAAAAKANFCANCSRKIQSQGESPTTSTTTKVASEMKVICCCYCCCCPQNTLRQHCAAQSAVHSGRHSANFRTHATFMECRRQQQQQQRQRCPLRGAAIWNFHWKIRRGEGNHCECVLATCCAQTCLQCRVYVCLCVRGDFNEFS